MIHIISTWQILEKYNLIPYITFEHNLYNNISEFHLSYISPNIDADDITYKPLKIPFISDNVNQWFNIKNILKVYYSKILGLYICDILKNDDNTLSLLTNIHCDISFTILEKIYVPTNSKIEILNLEYLENYKLLISADDLTLTMNQIIKITNIIYFVMNNNDANSIIYKNYNGLVLVPQDTMLEEDPMFFNLPDIIGEIPKLLQSIQEKVYDGYNVFNYEIELLPYMEELSRNFKLDLQSNKRGLVLMKEGILDNIYEALNDWIEYGYVMKIVNQINNLNEHDNIAKYSIKNPDMKKYVDKIKFILNTIIIPISNETHYTNFIN